MKRFISVFVVLLVISVSIPFAFSAQAADNVLFVTAGGAGLKDGSSPDNALGSLNTAFNTLSPTGGTIVLIGQMVAPNNCFFAKTQTTRMDIVLTSLYNGVDYRMPPFNAALVLDANAEFFNPHVTFENFNFIVRKDNLALYAVGIELTLKESCKVTLEGTTKMLSLSTKATADGLNEAGTFAEYQNGKINTINKGGVVGITFEDPAPAATTAASTTAAPAVTTVGGAAQTTAGTATGTTSPSTFDFSLVIAFFAAASAVAVILIRRRTAR